MDLVILNHGPVRRTTPKLTSPSTNFHGHGSLVVKVTNSWSAFNEFELSAAGDTPWRGTMHIKSLESLKVPPVGVVWYLVEGLPAQVSSTTLDHGSKLRCSSPKAFE
ncbi:hypothetical protein TNCV_2021821 [Trichonephila clavipes]|nr:hypothetical protein TNCV_2021821 [Trichonephila clavipes]